MKQRVTSKLFRNSLLLALSFTSLASYSSAAITVVSTGNVKSIQDPNNAAQLFFQLDSISLGGVDKELILRTGGNRGSAINGGMGTASVASQTIDYKSLRNLQTTSMPGPPVPGPMVCTPGPPDPITFLPGPDICVPGAPVPGPPIITPTGIIDSYTLSPSAQLGINTMMIDRDQDGNTDAIVEFTTGTDNLSEIDDFILRYAYTTDGAAMTHTEGLAALAAPEPSSALLLSAGLAGMLLRRRRS